MYVCYVSMCVCICSCVYYYMSKISAYLSAINQLQLLVHHFVYVLNLPNYFDQNQEINTTNISI